MSDVKQIQITGGAELVGGTRRRRKGAAKQDRGLQVQKGGGDSVVSYSGSMDGATAGASTNCIKGYLNPMIMSGSAPLDQAFKPLVPLAELSKTIPVAGAALPTGQAGGAGSQATSQATTKRKVELRKAPPSKKVQLHSKKPGQKHMPIKVKRKTRKIVLGLVSLERRQTRAKKISQRMKEMPIETLKKQLVEQGLIKAGSKAPESILRQIAADAQIVGGNGL
jgi:hypothetical protein